MTPCDTGHCWFISDQLMNVNIWKSYIRLRNEYKSHIRSDGHRNKSFFWSLAKTGKKIKCVNVPWFMSYRVKHSKRNFISTRSIYLDRSSNTVQGFWFIRVYPTLKVSQRFSVAAYNNKACAPSLNQTRRSDRTSIIVQTKIPSCQRKQTALSKKSPHYSFLCPVEIRTNFSSQKLLLIADGFNEHNRLEISVLESKCVEHNNDDFSSTV